MPSMNRNSPYYAQVQLLIRLLPMVAAETCFALKGGTAINLFVRDFPRLSVDIDLVYLLSSNRAEALADIRTALDRLADAFSQVVSFEDLFAGKICAALDRQHPRDLFDIRLLLANEGLTASLKQAFLAYL